MDGLTKINLDEVAPEESATQPMPSLNYQPVPSSPSRLSLVVVISLAVVLGLGSGWLVAKRRLTLGTSASPTSQTLTQNPSSASAVKVGDVYGTADEKTFNDHTEGVLVAGGIDGEGSHHLERGADKSQWVYLTSSVVDLDNFQGHKVEVWGATLQGKKAGWLMDVGRLKVLELGVGSGAGEPQVD